MRVSLNNQAVDSKRLFVIIVILVLIFLNIFQLIKYLEVKRELKEANQAIESRQINENVLNFSKLFIDKVLKAKTEIDFETRLNLENAVRGLKDDEVLAQWNKFVNSKNETEAQDEVKNLLEMLVGKIKVQ